MPRHEIIVERIPDEFQGKPVRLPPPSEMSHIYTQTVADYRSNNPKLLHVCPSCDLSFDMSSLEPVFDVWGAGRGDYRLPKLPLGAGRTATQGR